MNDKKYVKFIWGVCEYNIIRLTKDYIANLYANIRRKKYAWNDLEQSNRLSRHDEQSKYLEFESLFS